MKKFKTNIKCSACVEKVTPGLNDAIGEGQWHVDLTDPKRTLTTDHEVTETQVQEALQKTGYKAEAIPGE